MNRSFLISCLLSVFFFASEKKSYCQSFYDLNTVQNIELYFSSSNWDYMMDTAKAGSESYIMADWVRINGVQLDSVGVRYKGNSSYSPNKIKNPIHIELDHFVENNIYDGVTDIKLNNGFKDPSFIRETMAYSIARTYMDAPMANYARLFINGLYIGIYTNVESVTKKFVENHFFSNNNAFFKCNPAYSTNSKSNLAYISSDSTDYFNSYEIKSDNGWGDLIALCEILKFTPNDINDVLDIDRTLWMHAFNNLLVNLDSYLGSICQNYYLYKAYNGSFNPIVWDLNEAFGCFNNTGLGAPLNLTQMQQMSPWLHLSNTDRPLLQRLLNIPIYKKMYLAHYKTIFNEYFQNDYYLALADSFQQIIDSSVFADTYKLYSYADFSNNITQNIQTGMGSIPGISVLMSPRKNYLNNHVDMQLLQPVISNAVCADTNLIVSDTAAFKVHVNDALSVYFGFRYNQTQRFTRVLMFDDGQHQDELAGDSIYGVQIPVMSTNLEYYIYAENANAGRFLPERAEFEFFNQSFGSQMISQGDVVINEFMAVNNSIISNANNQYDDWIELFNNTNNAISLDGLYLSDNFSLPQKWQLPYNATIPPNGYLLIWASEDSNPNELHAPFKLSGSGERIILSYENGFVVDSLSFPLQTADIAYGRYPNGTGAFTFLHPTPLATNTPLEIMEHNKNEFFSVFPNPTQSVFSIVSNKVLLNSVAVFDIHGRMLFHEVDLNLDRINIDVENFEDGIYFIFVNDIYVLKLLKQ
ncbi:MAG: CotH kinase family protein [Bacteroidales bacterium]|nr:CotH kinase family protein [Bacteroidales bacterium]